MAACLVAGVLHAPANAQTAVGATSSTLTATVTITTAGSLSSINVLTQGAANKDFRYASGGTCAVGTSYAANATCTVEYTFAPTRPGQRLGGIVLMGASAPLGQTPITGTGTGPLAEFPGSTALSAVGGSFSLPQGIAVDGNGNVFVPDYGNHAVYEIEAGTGGNAAGAVSSSSTVVTVGSGFNNPYGVAVDGGGHVFVADYNNNAAKEIDLTAPPALSFASTAVGNTSSDSPKSVTVQNAGNADLSFSVVALGASPDFTLESGTCSTSSVLAWGTNCTVTASFAPVQPGSLSSTITLTDDTGNASAVSQNISLSGTATAATGATAQTITFPQPSSPAPLGTSVTLTATASSGLPVLYSVISGPGTVSGSTLTYTGTGTVVVEADQYGNNTYAPATAVQRSVAVQASDAVGSSSSTLTATVTIATAGVLSSINVLTQGAANKDFRYASGGTCAVGTSYAANATCTVEYTFAPTRPGQRLGGIVLMGASAPLGQTPITGVGTGPLAEFPGSTAVSTVGSGFSTPRGVAVDGSGNVFVASARNDEVKEIEAGTGGNAAGVVSTSSTVVTVGSGFSFPSGVAVDGSGNVFVADYGAVKEIEAGTGGNAAGVVSSSSTVVTVGSGFTYPEGVAVDGGGNVFVADYINNAVYEIEAGTGGNAAGVVSSSSTVVTVGSGFSGPAGVAVDGSGNVFVAVTGNNAVKEIEAGTGGNAAGVVSSSSTVVTVGGGFHDLSGVAVDGSGNVFVAVTGNNAVKEIEAGTGGNPAGVVSSSSTVVTMGSGFSGPFGVAVDGSGHVFIADTNNSAVKEIDLTAPPALSFASTVVGNTSNDSPESVTVQNAGNADLSITVPPAGTNPSVAANFSLAGASTCPSISTSGPAGSLPQNGLCTYAFNFTPTMAGSISGSAVLTDDNLNNSATQTIHLSGTGIALVAITPSPALTGNALAATDGIAVNETFTVSGGSGSGYALSSTGSLPGGLTLTPSGSTTGASWTLSGTPSAAAGSYSFSLTATDSTYTTDTVTQNYTLVVSAGAPYAFTASAGTPQSAYVNVAFATALTATVTDAYGNGVGGLTVSFTAPASGASAALSASTCTTGATGSCSVTATANGTTGSYDVSASVSGYSPLGSVSFALTNNPPPNYVVNETGDGAGNASDCSAQPTARTTTNSDSCTLRDALAAASAAGAGNITFDNTIFAAAQTIMLVNGTLTIPNNTTITGPTAAGAASANNPQGNLVTVDGTHLTNLSIFAINSGSTAAVANLVVQSETPSDANGIENQGTFSFINSALLNYRSTLGVTSLDNTGTVTVTGSTFANDIYGIRNEAGATATVTGSTFATDFSLFRNYGTATISYSTFKVSVVDYLHPPIYTSGSMTLLNSTVYGTTINGKSPIPTAGAVSVNGGTLNLGNSIVYGNTYSGGGAAAVPSDVYVGSSSTLNDLGGNYIGTETGATTTTLHSTPVNLSAFGSQGGNGMAVLLPLPGSPAICAGVAANLPNGATTDQRGLPNKNITYTGYNSGTPCVDAGAVQTAYSLKFDQQPSSVAQNASMLPAPTVELDENGSPFKASAETVPLALTTGTGTVTGGSATTSTATGIATYSALSIDTLGTGDVLTASLALNPAIATNAPTITKASNTFNVNSAVTQLAFSTAPASTVTAGGNAGAAIVVHEEDVNGALVTTAGDSITLTVTGPNSYAKTYTATAVSGVATFDLSGDALTAAGNYSYSAAITGNGTVTPATASETLNSAAAATVSVISGSNQSAVIGAAFASPLTVKVVDQYNNPVPNATVVFTAPASGASASLSTPAVTAADGTTSVTATANGLAGATAYTVTASASGATTSANFSLTNNQHSTTLTVAPSSLALVYGQPVTVNASIAPASVLTSAPTGAVTFYDGAAAITPASTVASAAASYAIAVPTVGSHTYAAQYAGDANFQPSSKTSATQTLVVSPASSTLHGPASESFTYGAGGSFAVTVTGQYSGAGIATPSGSVTYTIGGGTAQTAVLTAGSATLTIPSTQSAGNYIVAISYLGDGNYNAATSINVPVTVKQVAATINVTPYSVTYDAAAHTATGTATGVGGVNLAADLTLSGTTHTAAGTYASDAWSFHDPAGNYADASGTVSDHIGTATLNVAASNATKIYGTANPAFTGTVTGQQNGDTFTESFSTSATASSPVNTYSIVPSVTGANLSDYTQAITDGTLTVTQAASMTALHLSSTSITPGQSVTLTATVADASVGSTGTPAGSVSFYDGTTLLSTVALSGGVASYSTTALAGGVTHALTAMYSGDTNFTASSSTSSASVTVAPLDFTMTISGPTTATVVPGSSITYQVTVTPDYGSYPGTVNFAISGLPSGARATFSPASIAANGGPQTITVTIQTAPATAALERAPAGPTRGQHEAPFALALLALFGFGGLRKRSRTLRRLLCVIALLTAGAAATLSLSGCGTKAGFFSQAEQNYTVTITATAGSLQHTATVTLNVQ